MHDNQNPTSNASPHQISRWKMVIALALTGLFALGTVGSLFGEQGISGAMIGLGLAVIPLLYLSHQRRKVLRGNSDVAAQASRNWLPAGIALVVALLIGGSIVQEASKPTRDPDAVMVDVTGKILTEAKDTLKSMDLAVKTTDDTGNGRSVYNSQNWTVTSQDIAVGDRLGDRAEVELGVVKTGESTKADAPESGVTQSVEQEPETKEVTTPSGTDIERQIEDESFIFYLDQNGIPYYGDRDAAIRAGRITCDYIASASSPTSAVLEAVRTAQESGYTRNQAEQIVGSAIGVFCDQYMQLVK